MSWINKFNCALLLGSTAISTGNLLQSLLCWNTLLDSIHEFAHVNELIAASLVVSVEILFGDITLGELEVA